MEATMTTPNGTSDACEIRDLPGHTYEIKFVPPEDGIHTISIKYKGIHITGLSLIIVQFASLSRKILFHRRIFYLSTSVLFEI